jgi:hypothetical protein
MLGWCESVTRNREDIAKSTSTFQNDSSQFSWSVKLFLSVTPGFFFHTTKFTVLGQFGRPQSLTYTFANKVEHLSRVIIKMIWNNITFINILPEQLVRCSPDCLLRECHFFNLLSLSLSFHCGKIACQTVIHEMHSMTIQKCTSLSVQLFLSFCNFDIRCIGRGSFSIQIVPLREIRNTISIENDRQRNIYLTQKYLETSTKNLIEWTFIQDFIVIGSWSSVSGS